MADEGCRLAVESGWSMGPGVAPMRLLVVLLLRRGWPDEGSAGEVRVGGSTRASVSGSAPPAVAANLNASASVVQRVRGVQCGVVALVRPALARLASCLRLQLRRLLVGPSERPKRRHTRHTQQEWNMTRTLPTGSASCHPVSLPCVSTMLSGVRLVRRPGALVLRSTFDLPQRRRPLLRRLATLHAVDSSSCESPLR